MPKLYQFNDIQYSIKKIRGSRSIKISVHEDGRVSVSLPKWVTLKTAHNFVEEREDWIRAQQEKLQEKQDQMPEHLKIRKQHPDTPANRKAARKIITERLEEIRQQHYPQSRINRVSIRNMRTRWGSCSSQGNISISYIVAFLPPELRDYVLIHEIAHLTHLNHSKQFWQLVSRADSQYAAHKKQLNSYK